MNDSLTADEYDALAQIGNGTKTDRPSACVARNAKRLTGIKYAAYGKDGQLVLTEKAKQALFVKNCIDGLRAIANDPLATLKADVAMFLGKKGHISPRAPADGFDITGKGREILADIDASRPSS